jgi:hypothetical protein
MQKMEDVNLRQIERITSLLMKIKRQEREMETSENDAV